MFGKLDLERWLEHFPAVNALELLLPVVTRLVVVHEVRLPLEALIAQVAEEQQSILLRVVLVSGKE